MLYIAAATVPAVVLGVILKTTGFIDAVRGPHIVAWNAIVFALLMLVADRLGAQRRTTADMTLWSALAVGAAQALALVPGTSRSGITITTARALGFTRPESARFSFLVGMPAIAGAGLLVLGEAMEAGEPISAEALLVGGLTFFTSLAAIAFLMAILRRYSLLPFVIYRIVLGLVLLGLIQAGILV